MNDMFTLENILNYFKASKSEGYPIFYVNEKPNWAGLENSEIESPVMEQDKFKYMLSKCISITRNLNSKQCLEMTQGMFLFFFFGGYKTFVEYANGSKGNIDTLNCLANGKHKYLKDKENFAEDLTFWKCNYVTKAKVWEFKYTKEPVYVPQTAVSLTEYIIQMNEYIIDTYCKQKDRLIGLLEKYASIDLSQEQGASKKIDAMKYDNLKDLQELLSLLARSARASENKKKKTELIAEGLTWLITACVLRSKFPADQDEFDPALEEARKNASKVEVIKTEEKGAPSNNRRDIPKCLTSFGPMSLEIDLIGRDDIVKKVRSMLDQQACISLVSGLGGIGKTAVMQKVYESIYKDGIEKNHVAWITCGDSLEDDLLTMRDTLGVPKEYNREDAYAALVQALKSFPDTLYLFMDDMARIPSAAEMRRFTALGPNMRIMITSRYEIAGISPKDRIDLFVLAADDALNMFYGYYQRDKEREYVEDARNIIESDSVGRHTLLVELIAKAANRSFDTLDAFRRKLEEKGFFDVSHARLSSGHDENLTIEESVIKLYEISGLTDEQKRIMSLFSIFTPERVIYGKVVEWAGLDENDVEELVKLGWLVRTEGGYLIHQIVRDSIARQVGDSLRIEEYGELLVRVVDTESYMPMTLVYTKVRERLVFAEDVARYFKRITGSTMKAEKWSEKDIYLLTGYWGLLKNMADVYHDRGEYAKALGYYEKALEISERVLGSDHPLRATINNSMALTYKEQGDYAKALEYCEKALEIRERVLGSDHLDTATTHNIIAGVYKVMGDYAKALEYQKKAERILGNDHPNIATTYSNMADVYHTQGDYAKALEYYEKALDICERVLGNDHPSTATSYNNMGIVYYAQGDNAKALEYYEKALDIYERVLGNDHPSTAMTYNNKAVVYKDQGDNTKALECYEKALDIYERVLGSDHPSTATVYSNMAAVYEEQGDYAKALEYCEKALEISERVLGSDHPLTATTYNNMAWVYRDQGNYIIALEYYEKALAVFRKRLGENHSDTQNTQKSVEIMKKLLLSPTAIPDNSSDPKTTAL